MNKKIKKKTGEELREYLSFRRRGTTVPPKKGKGSIYSRKSKHKNERSENNADA